MKAVRYFIFLGIFLAYLLAPREGWAQTNAPISASAASTGPVEVAPRGKKNSSGVPVEIQPLINDFNQTRDQYLAQQELLQEQLKHATTAAEREQIRNELQANRQAFLTMLKKYREQLKDELAALKGKISHEEFLRIINAAHNATAEGGIGHHKGH